jgi:predicted cupin superfamily sugar epimerase
MKEISMEYLIEKLGLKPHWNGDFLTEFYTSDLVLNQAVIGRNFDGERPIFNWVYYLLPEGVICPFHLHLADESWQFCAGGPLDLILIHNSDGHLERVRIGNNLKDNENFIYIVPKNVWMAARTVPGGEYTLITHLVSPAFYPQDNTKGYNDLLIDKFPQHKLLIEELAWPKGR